MARHTSKTPAPIEEPALAADDASFYPDPPAPKGWLIALVGPYHPGKGEPLTVVSPESAKVLIEAGWTPPEPAQ